MAEILEAHQRDVQGTAIFYRYAALLRSLLQSLKQSGCTGLLI